jgi:hypothetical protein
MSEEIPGTPQPPADELYVQIAVLPLVLRLNNGDDTMGIDQQWEFMLGMMCGQLIRTPTDVHAHVLRCSVCRTSLSK